MSPRNPPRVLLVGLGLELSGSGRFLSGLAVSLDRAGVDTDLFVVRDGPLRPEMKGTGVRLTVASPDLPDDAGRARLGFVPFFRLVAHIRRSRPDVIHTNLFGLDLIGRTAAFLCRAPIVISTQHDINPRPWHVNAFRRMTVSRIAATVACSESVAEYCRDVMIVPENKLLVIENGIDAGRLGGVVTSLRTPSRFLAMGALVPAKGHSVLLDAFARVLEPRPDATLTIYGEGPLRAELLSLASSLGIAGAVRIVPPTPDIVGILSEADVFVQPSLREGLPQSMLEAMAAGKPVIATDVSSHSSVLDHGRCGVLVPPNDSASLAEAMLAALSNHEAAGSMGKAAQQRVRERYSLERMAGEYAALYERLIALSSRG